MTSLFGSMLAQDEGGGSIIGMWQIIGIILLIILIIVYFQLRKRQQ